ncbi:LysR substrate-binding domain-containing protein [Mesorhizobium sp. M1E.F.Ca.ET.041.01.1.1]|uniref:LysR substrate-binding domain-containing protein n=1 Tax=Mesorhizobium sp. M1E.F.Ca.ET.041.01.1.1 TaxID=2496759 RepID=UPI000FCAD70E|nr:LysR substrate-binding domain-containing protein [Mesorhizobium sp. M1E.F.Ca.ET.041.01.1.1]RUW36311.1 LysR family transcriptional regulator [Mesorhizobium sp. M1E.F.Ca.ET.041.01.1.1]
MDIRLDWLRAFRAIMQTGTVTGAADFVLRTQPQVSRMLARLEASLNFQLFTREGRRLIPTENGLRFYAHIEPILMNFDGLKGVAEDIRTKRGKPLIIAAEPFLLHSLLPKAVETMHSRTDAKFAIDMCVREVGLWMSRSNVDLALVALPFTHSDMERVAFAEAELVASLPTGHPLAEREIVHLTDLAAEPFIALRHTTLLRSQIDLALMRSGGVFRPFIETGSGATACSLVARGLGVSVSDPIVANSFEREGVVVRRLSTQLKLTYGLLVDSRASASPHLREMVSCLIEAVQELGKEFVTVEPYGKVLSLPIFGKRKPPTSSNVFRSILA